MEKIINLSLEKFVEQTWGFFRCSLTKEKELIDLDPQELFSRVKEAKIISKEKPYIDFSYRKIVNPNLIKSYGNSYEDFIKQLKYNYSNGLGYLDLSNSNLEGLIAPKIFLPYVNLTNSNLKEAYLPESDFLLGNISGTNLTKANLEKARLTSVTVNKKTNFTEAKLMKSQLTDVKICETIKNKTDLSGADLMYLDLKELRKDSCKLDNCKLYDTKISYEVFESLYKKVKDICPDIKDANNGYKDTLEFIYQLSNVRCNDPRFQEAKEFLAPYVKMLENSEEEKSKHPWLKIN
jgi:uncharacterized protein YjbI with pentapeptide repeats